MQQSVALVDGDQVDRNPVGGLSGVSDPLVWEERWFPDANWDGMGCSARIHRAMRPAAPHACGSDLRTWLRSFELIESANRRLFEHVVAHVITCHVPALLLLQCKVRSVNYQSLSQLTSSVLAIEY